MYKVKVDKFEGPLDLLLELIEKDKLDITNISLSKITDSYLAEVSKLDPKDFNVAEFLIVAARLIYIKSKAILPTLETEEEEQEIENLKTKLEIYKKYKEAANQFSDILKKNQRSFPAKKPQLILTKFTPPKGIDMNELWSVFQKLLVDMPEELSREEVELPSEKVTVEERLAHLENIFSKKRRYNFSQIMKDSKSKLEAIVTFLAVLEMVKCKRISVSQTSNFKDIKLSWVK